MDKCIEIFTKLLMPSDSAVVVVEIMGDTELNKFISSMVSGYTACKRGSVRIRMLRELMESC